MSVFKDIERKIESIMEGAFQKVLRKKIEPVELSHEIEKSMDESTVHGGTAPFTANIYHIKVNPKDYKILKPFIGELTSQLEVYVSNQAEQKGVTLLGEPEVSIRTSKSVKAGHIRVVPEVRKKDAEEFIKESKDLDKTQAIPISDIKDSDLTYAPCYLESLASAKKFFLTRFPARIGRLESNDVQTSDLAASRIHAEITQEGKNFYIHDLESTNGTYLNGKKIKKKRLTSGDVIKVGETKFKWVRTE